MRAKLFVGNLNYETSIDNLEAVFRPFQGYLHTKICYERHTGKPLGYAVVHFDNPAAAQYAIDILHNAEVDGRHIVVAPYRPRVSDASAPNASPRPPSRPAANEAVALVMDLNKNATWMDLKDIMSQRSKVLFVDEPRMIRAAFVHFASEEDREQARVVFRNTQVLGSTVDIVPITKDSVLMGWDHNGADEGHAHQHRHQPPQPDGSVRGQHMPPQAMLPVTYMTPGMAPMPPPYMGMEQPYQMQRPQMWQPAAMHSTLPFVPQFALPPMQMRDHRVPAQHNTANSVSPANAPPAPAGMSPGAGPSMTTQNHVASSGIEGPNMQQYPPGVSRGFLASAAPANASSGASTAAAQPSAPTEGLPSDGTANLHPDLQQLVRQLAMQQLNGDPTRPSPDDR